MTAHVVIHERVAEVEWLLGTASPDEIAARLGYSDVDHLRRTMRRAGRYDLSDRLGPDSTIGDRTRTAMRRFRSGMMGA